MFEADDPCNASFHVANIKSPTCGLSIETGHHQTPEKGYPLQPSLTGYLLSLKESQELQSHPLVHISVITNASETKDGCWKYGL